MGILTKTGYADPNKVPVGTDLGNAPFGLAAKVLEQAQKSLPGSAGSADLGGYKSFVQAGQAGYEDPQHQLGMVDPAAGLKYDPRYHSYASDLYQYYLGGGMPTGTGGPPGRGGSAGGPPSQGGGGGIETVLSPGPALPDLGGAQNPLTQMVTDPATGQTMTVRQAMTSDDAYRGTVADPSGVTTAIAPPGILNPEQIGRQNVTGDITDYIDPIDLDPNALNQAGRLATQVGGQTALMRSGAKGLYSPIDMMKSGTSSAAKANILAKTSGAGLTGGRAAAGIAGFKGGVKPTWAGTGRTFVGAPNVAATYGDEILDVATPSGGMRTIGGGIGRGAVAIGEEVALDPRTATKGLSLAQRLKAGAYPTSATAQRLLQTGTTAARPIAKIAGRALPGVGAGLAAMDVASRLNQEDPDYVGAALGAASGLPLVGIPFLGAQMAYDQLRDPNAPTTEEIARDSQYGSYMPDQAVTGITGPAGMDYADTGIESRIADADTGYRDPIMDMAAAGKPGMLGDEGFSNADIQTAQSPESKSLLEKVKSGTATAGDYVSKYGMSAWNFAKGNMMTGFLGAFGGGPLALAGLAGAQKTNVTPEDRASNAAFEQKHGISVGQDGRITSGPLQGKIPPGKSFAGSANYDEMIDDKINDIKNRKAPQTDASRLKIAELEALKGPETRDQAIDEGILAAEDDKGTDMLDIPTEEDEDLTDLMGFETLGPWATDDTPIDEPTAPTGIEGPPSIISDPFTPTGPTGADVHGGGRDEPSGPTGGPPGGGDPGMKSAPSAPAGGPHGGGGMDIGRGSPGSMPTGTGGPPSRGGSAGGPPSQGGGGGGGGCFVKGTPITMADGSTKPVEQVDLGDEIAEGGKVFAAGRFLTEELHDYEGIKVSGSHMVNEDGTWVRVRDSEKGKSLGDDEHTVYVFGAENRRILIKGILFTDYFEVKEQDQLATMGDKYFQVWKDHDKILVNLEEQNNVAMLNAD